MRLQKHAKNIIFLARERIYTSTAYVLAFSPRDHWCRVYNFADCCANSRPTALSCLLQLLNVALSNRHRFTRHRRRRREDSNNRIGISISTYYVPLFPRHINFQSSSRHSLLYRSVILPCRSSARVRGFTRSRRDRLFITKADTRKIQERLRLAYRVDYHELVSLKRKSALVNRQRVSSNCSCNRVFRSKSK